MRKTKNWIFFFVKWKKEVQLKPTKKQSEIRKLLSTQKEKVKKNETWAKKILKTCVNKPT